MAELRALWWWIDRWRKSTAYTDMTLEEQGAYRNLLDEAQLRGGPLPNDERVLAKVCGDALAWERVRAAVLARFELKADGWHNETLDQVIAESTRRADKQKRYRAGRSPGNASGNAASNASGLRLQSPSPSPSRDQKIVVGPKTAFEGQRFKVWKWQHDEFVRALGSKSFDLIRWYPQLDAEMTRNGQPIADEQTWLKQQFYDAAGIQRPNLFGKTVDRERSNVPSLEDSERRRAALRAGN